MWISGRLALLLTASVVGAGLTATTTTAASAATTSRADAVGLTTSVGAATTGCAAKAVAQRDATTYSSLAPKALIGVASHNIQGQHASGWTNWPGRRDALATQRYNGSAIGYIFVSYTVRARTWETVVPAASTNGIAKSPPSDHNMIMTWAHV
jgi:hypothetical protein